MKNEVQKTEEGKYILVKKGKVHKFLTKVEAGGVVNKGIAVDTTGDFVYNRVASAY